MSFAVSCNFSSFFYSSFLLELPCSICVCSGAAPSLVLCILQASSRTHRCTCSVVSPA
jgi:hypothetical protein